MTEIAVLIALVYALSAFTYSLGAVFRTLPVPRQEWRAYGPMLTWDASVSLFAISSISAIQLLMTWLSSLLNQSFPGPFSSSAASFGIITSQLALIDTTLVVIVTAVSSTVVLSPVAEVLARMFGPAIFWVTSAIILWAMIAIAISFFPKIWLWSYVIGVCFYALPFRLGRKLGAYLMASSIIVAVALPILPSLALEFQGFIGYEGAFRGLVDLASQIMSNPLAIPLIIASLPQAMAALMAAVIISLIVFPVAYLFALSLLVRSSANLIGGSSLILTSSFFLGPSKQVAKGLAE